MRPELHQLVALFVALPLGVAVTALIAARIFAGRGAPEAERDPSGAAWFMVLALIISAMIVLAVLSAIVLWVWQALS
ncbi:MAG: hypothetical protein SV862_00025 [Pseudomonadota bacterium]|nr:hypothetical protein [Pseudomonadota bacterium]